MAAIWKGSLSFGLVTFPVEMQTAVREESISFRLLHAKDNSPVKYERVCAAEGVAIPYSEIVKGYEYAKGKFVIMEDKDFEKAALKHSKAIDIIEFVKEAEIDPRFFEKPYYLVPQDGGQKAYALLREALKSTGTVGLGKVTIRQKSWLVGIRALGDAIVVDSLRFANELVNPDEYTFPSSEELRPQELKMAEQLIENFAEAFDPSKYTDEYRENLMQIINAKMEGEEIEFEEPAAPEDTKVIDLMDKLRASLEASKGRSKKAKAGGAEDEEPAEDEAAEKKPAKRRTSKKARKTA